MEWPSDYNHALILQSALFLIPVNIYLIGNGVAAGIQWILFRYQQSYLGNSLIVFTKDLQYALSGIFTGKSAIAAELAFAATCIFIISTVLLILACRKKCAQWVKLSAVLTMSSGVLFLGYDFLQYGISLQGMAGFTIPLGVPAIFFVGIWIHQMDLADMDPDEDE